jgi:hypothetical protein
MGEWCIKDNLERIWKEVVITWSRYCHRIYLEELMKTTRYLSRRPVSRQRFKPVIYRMRVCRVTASPIAISGMYFTFYCNLCQLRQTSAFGLKSIARVCLIITPWGYMGKVRDRCTQFLTLALHEWSVSRCGLCAVEKKVRFRPCQELNPSSTVVRLVT